MSTWRDKILKEFSPGVARLTLVADPDALLIDEGVLQGIREKGFDLITFDDHAAFRYAYESKYRVHWDRNELTDLVVVLRAQMQDLRSLPFDLLQTARKLSFNIGDLFPQLSYPVVDALDRGSFDALYDAVKRHNPGNLGDNGTKDFILLHVFEIAPHLLKQPADLLRVLLRRHYRDQRIPPLIEGRFIHVLRDSGCFDGWPLEQIVSDKVTFCSFLQERWPGFLERLAGQTGEHLETPTGDYGLSIPGPAELPFGHDDVRVYIDNLFVEGLLKPVVHPKAERLRDKWVKVGLVSDPTTDRAERFGALLKAVQEAVPAAEARHHDWCAFALRWAQLKALHHEAAAEHCKQSATAIPEDLKADIAGRFSTWLQLRYGGLHNQPPSPPVMVHHVPKALQRHREQSKGRKIALVVMDGLALDQWLTVKRVLELQNPPYRFRESALYAWIPTLTTVSRQAIFSGKTPLYFPNSIMSTERDAAQWSQFWADHGAGPAEAAYLRGLGDPGSLGAVAERISDSRVSVLGLVVDKPDRIMHGMELGAAGMHNQLRQWAQEGFMDQLLTLLIKAGFDLFLTADHGNVEAAGIGRPGEGATADLRGQRVRVFPDNVLRAKVKAAFPASMEWPAIGLPEEFIPLLAPENSAFVAEGERIVGHGGASLEEVVVPFVQISMEGV
jgi:hypothetical protein